MRTVLLDTDFVIDFLRGNTAVQKQIVPLLKTNSAFLSILSVYELYAGMLPNEQQATDDFIHACKIEPVTIEVARNAGLYRFNHSINGLTLSIVDCIIAETARTNQHLLATHNKKHYPENLFWPAT